LKSDDLPNEVIPLCIPGAHNAFNACAALAAIRQIQHGLFQDALHAIKQYSGTSRRFEIIGKVNGITIIDDYAHHPSQIRSTIHAARCQYPQQTIWAVWQPHTFSRTRTLLNEYAESFAACDHVIVTEIYAAREQDTGFSAQQVVDKMNHKDARFIPSLNDAARYLNQNLTSGDILLVLSAGDATQISQEVLDYLEGGNSGHG
jgi:UDP-N-acetylmuramate--alanine ligase